MAGEAWEGVLWEGDEGDREQREVIWDKKDVLWGPHNTSGGFVPRAATAPTTGPPTPLCPRPPQAQPQVPAAWDQGPLCVCVCVPLLLYPFIY